MFEEEYSTLNMSEQDDFKRIVNYLLGHTYLLSRNYSVEMNDITNNLDYNFVIRKFDLFSDYFSYADFNLMKDEDYGIIYIRSDYDNLHHKLDKITTQILLALRILYDDGLRKMQSSRYVLTTVGEINQILRNAGVTENKLNSQSMMRSLSLIRKFNVIEKGDGMFSQDSTKVVILPTIVIMVPASKLALLAKLIDARNEEEEVEDDQA